ncbi:MAG: serine/threonine protein kinase, partial [Chloroflexi bacterium]
MRLIGQGRFGMVYHAAQPQLGRDVAVKVICSEVANDPDFVRKFETEAQLVARLEHIHIVPLYDYWREPDRAFLVMRWLPRGSVRDSLAQYGPWSVGAAARLINQIASALAMAHRKDVLHRDVKPDNILLDEEGNALLTDFGIAASVGTLRAPEARQHLTGTPAYMAPELFMGDPASPQSDIYSLGVLMFEVLTNSRPFPDRTTEQAMHHHLSSPVPSLQSTGLPLPTELNMVIWRATAKAPQARYNNVLDLAGAFQSAVAGTLGSDIIRSPVEFAPPTPTSPTQEIATLIIEPPLPPDNPYKGLRPFEQADVADFFGREALVVRLLDRLGGSSLSRGFLALVGPSGSGKSSAIKAGLIPALRSGGLPGSERWFVVEMVPGDDPFRSLEVALQRVAVNPITDTFRQLATGSLSLLKVVERILPGDAGTRLVLLIDQFEEVFTQVESETERQQFLDMLATAIAGMSDRLLLLITLRADYYDRPLLYERFGTLIRECTEVILPLNTQELQAAIIGPAERTGLVIEPELVAAMIADVSQQPGALPLLQYALTEVFEHRSGQALRLAAYREIGGISGALARRADEVYNGLAPDRQDLARQMFLRMTGLNEEDEATRRRLSWSALTSLTEDRQAVNDIRDAFVKYRLLTADR